MAKGMLHLSRVTPERVLEMYEDLLLCSARMLKKARDGHWKDLLAEEVEFVKTFDCIACQESRIFYSTEQCHRRKQLLDEVLQKNEETQLMLRSRKAELARLTVSECCVPPLSYHENGERSGSSAVGSSTH